MRRSVALWAVLFAAYGATLWIDAAGTSHFAGDEPRYLRAAETLASTGKLDEDAPGVGLPALIAPASAVGGDTAVELFLAAVAALAFVLAAALGRRIVPDPWATRAALLVGLSPPALAFATAVYPDLAAGAALCGAILLALRVREDPHRRDGLVAAGLLALLPWLGAEYLIAGVPVLLALVHWTMRHGRRTLGLLEVEFVAGSLVAYATVNDVLYGRITPPGGPDAADLLDRAPRLLGLWIDRDVGLLRWAPVLALSFVGAYLLWRSRRERLARLAPARRDTEVAATLAVIVCGATVLTAVFAATALSGPWFAGRHLVAALPCAAALAAWGLRWAPRWGAALGALTMLASLWLVGGALALDGGSWVHPGTDAPLGPLVDALPRF